MNDPDHMTSDQGTETDRAEKPEGCTQPCRWFATGAPVMYAHGETVRVLSGVRRVSEDGRGAAGVEQAPAGDPGPVGVAGEPDGGHRGSADVTRTAEAKCKRCGRTLYDVEQRSGECHNADFCDDRVRRSNEATPTLEEATAFLRERCAPGCIDDEIRQDAENELEMQDRWISEDEDDDGTGLRSPQDPPRGSQ